MKTFIATRIIILGHLISSVGCRIHGHHEYDEEYRYNFFCVMCGRRK